jgi:hypothetical protein
MAADNLKEINAQVSIRPDRRILLCSKQIPIWFVLGNDIVFETYECGEHI